MFTLIMFSLHNNSFKLESPVVQSEPSVAAAPVVDASAVAASAVAAAASAAASCAFAAAGVG